MGQNVGSLEDEYATVIAVASGDRFGSNLPMGAITERVQASNLIPAHDTSGRQVWINPEAISWMLSTT